MRTLSLAFVGLVGVGLVFNTIVLSQEGSRPEPAVVKDLVKGSIHHRPPGGKQVEWERIVGKVQIINPSTLQFADGTRIDLGRTPELNEKATKEANEFVSKLIGDQTVTSFGYVGDMNIQHALIINGWGLANHSSLHPAEVIARERNRGYWRNMGFDPGKRTALAQGRPNRQRFSHAVPKIRGPRLFQAGIRSDENDRDRPKGKGHDRSP